MAIDGSVATRLIPKTAATIATRLSAAISRRRRVQSVPELLEPCHPATRTLPLDAPFRGGDTRRGMLKKWLGLLGLPVTETRTLRLGHPWPTPPKPPTTRRQRPRGRKLGPVLRLVGALALGGGGFYAVYAGLVDPAGLIGGGGGGGHGGAAHGDGGGASGGRAPSSVTWRSCRWTRS